MSLVITIPALAIPPLPSSFYGTVKFNDANAPDGAVIQALVGGQMYAEGFTQTYQGNSVYALDVPGDNTDTATQDGAREGDTIQFKIGGVLADQTAVWHAGTNVNLNLTASSSEPISTPQATPSPVPTQTAIVLIQPSSTPTTISQAFLLTPTTLAQPSQAMTQPAQPSQAATQPAQPSQAATQPAQPSQVATKASQSSPMPTLHVQPSLTPVASENDKDTGSGNNARVAGSIITLGAAILIGYVFLVLRKKK